MVDIPFEVTGVVARLILGFVSAWLSGLNFMQYYSYSGVEGMRRMFLFQCVGNAVIAIYLIVGAML